jgi:2-amino-4-hydroxy-6-hydroxymethyldihydropteridine diphosphokinase
MSECFNPITVLEGPDVAAAMEEAEDGLGANLGPARTTLQWALRQLYTHPAVQLHSVSSLYRSLPVDAEGPDYLNAVALLSTTLSPEALLDLLAATELDAGRERPYHHAPRTLDLDLLVFGRAAGNHIVEFNKTTTHKSLTADAADATLARIARLDNASEGEYAQDVANDIRAAMQQHAGVFRTQAIMDEGVRKIAALRERVKKIGLKDKSKIFNTARIEALEVENLIESAEATIVSAAARRESRGAHTVDDYGDTPEHPNGRNDTEWHKHTLWHRDGNKLTYKPVQMKPLTVDSIPLKTRTF